MIQSHITQIVNVLFCFATFLPMFYFLHKYMIHSHEPFCLLLHFWFTSTCSVHICIFYFCHIFGSHLQHMFHIGGQFLQNLLLPVPPWHFVLQNFLSFLHLQVLEIKQSLLHWQWLSFPPEALKASPACVSDIILCLILS